MAPLIKFVALAALLLQLSTEMSAKSTKHKSCKIAADIVFLLDTSSSVWPKLYHKHVKDFLKNVVDKFNVGPGAKDTRVGVALFSSSTYLQFHLNQYWTAEDVKNAVQRMPFIEGDTYTHSALAFATDSMLKPEHGARKGVAKLVVVITDGRSRFPNKTKKETTRLKATGADIFAIGVGLGRDVKFDELQTIASSPSEKFAYRVTNFQALSSIMKRFTESTCQVLQTTTTTTTTTIPTTIKTTPTTTTASTTSTKTSTTPETRSDEGFEKVCGGKPADIYFLLDSSFSVQIDKFHNRVLPFVSKFVSAFEVSPKKTRFGLVSYSDKVKHVFGLEKHRDVKSLLEAIQPEKVAYLNGSANTGDAISFVIKEGFGGVAARRDAAQIIIIVTGGHSKCSEETKTAAVAAKAKGIYMFSVGIGKKVDGKELAVISSDPDKDFVFNVKSFAILKSIASLLGMKTCKKRIVDCSDKPLNVMFLYEYMNSIPNSKKVRYHFITNFSNQVAQYAPHVKLGILTQPCIEGDIPLTSSTLFLKEMASSKTRDHVGLSNLVKQLRKNKFYNVPSTETRVVVLVLDADTKYHAELKKEVQKLRSQNVRIMVVAVGKVLEALIEEVASDPLNQNVIRVKGYDDLKMKDINILKSMCANKRWLPYSNDGLFGPQ